jgi:hypothetical protein
MPRQLYFQYVLLSQLVWSASVESALYFSQRRPRELATFEWTIDAKDPRRVTTYENWWRDILAPALESRSRRDANYCFPKTWPNDREQRARIIGEWLQTEMTYGIFRTNR